MEVSPGDIRDQVPTSRVQGPSVKVQAWIVRTVMNALALTALGRIPEYHVGFS